ncbi:MAG: hypothetical protein PHO55_10960 [Thiomonas arsenitoxydans]|nr:hypothetical protein [Thiomonas arsenitoxydans]
MFEVTVSGDLQAQFQELRDILSSASTEAILRDVGRVVGEEVISLIGEYPPASGNELPLYYTRVDAKGRSYKSKFKSLRQQRRVFALIREGKVPYRRTGTLGKSLTWDIESSSAERVVVVVGTNIPYGPLVYDEERQSHYHRGTWTPIQVTIRDNLPALAEVAGAELARHIREQMMGHS